MAVPLLHPLAAKLVQRNGREKPTNCVLVSPKLSSQTKGLKA